MRLIPILMLLGLCLSCAAGPPQPDLPGPKREGIRYQNKAVGLYTKGCFARALKYFNEAHEHFSAVDDLQGVAQSLESMANTHYQLQEFDSALLIYDEAQAVYSTLGDRDGSIRIMINEAAVLIEAGRLDEAESALAPVEARSRLNGRLNALRLKTRAILLLKQDRAPQAESLLDQALKHASPADRATLAGIHYTLGDLQRRQGNIAPALKHFSDALAIDRASGAYHDVAKDLAALGACHAQSGEYRKAVDYLKRSAKIFALVQDAEEVRDVVEQLHADALKAEVDIRATLAWIKQWLEGRTEANICR